MHPSGLRLPVRERRFRRGLRTSRHRLRRSARCSHPRHGTEGPRQDADGEGRRAGRARLSRRTPGRQISQGKGLRDRLSGADQAGGGRRRPRHAPGRQARRFRGRARRRDPRKPVGVRLRPGPDRETHRRAPAYRDSGFCRPAWQHHSSRRARLLAAAPPSEGDRGSAGARHDGGFARADGRSGGRGGEGGRIIAAPARSNSSPTAARACAPTPSGSSK